MRIDLIVLDQEVVDEKVDQEAESVQDLEVMIGLVIANNEGEVEHDRAAVTESAHVEAEAIVPNQDRDLVDVVRLPIARSRDLEIVDRLPTAKNQDPGTVDRLRRRKDRNQEIVDRHLPT